MRHGLKPLQTRIRVAVTTTVYADFPEEVARRDARAVSTSVGGVSFRVNVPSSSTAERHFAAIRSRLGSATVMFAARISVFSSRCRCSRAFHFSSSASEIPTFTIVITTRSRSAVALASRRATRSQSSASTMRNSGCSSTSHSLRRPQAVSSDARPGPLHPFGTVPDDSADIKLVAQDAEPTSSRTDDRGVPPFHAHGLDDAIEDRLCFVAIEQEAARAPQEDWLCSRGGGPDRTPSRGHGGAVGNVTARVVRARRGGLSSTIDGIGVRSRARSHAGDIRRDEVPLASQIGGLHDDLHDVSVAQSGEVGDGLLAEAAWTDPQQWSLWRHDIRR